VGHGAGEEKARATAAIFLKTSLRQLKLLVLTITSQGAIEAEMKALRRGNRVMALKNGFVPLTQPFQGCPRSRCLTQGSSRTRNPGLNYGIPLGFSPVM